MKICPICKKKFDGKFVHCSKECGYKSVSLKKKVLWESDMYRKEMNEVMSSKKYKEKMSNSIKKTFSDISFRERFSNIMKEVTSKPSYKEIQSKNSLNNWKNLEYAKKCLTSGFHYKNYKLPSGKIVKIQGYENLALDFLLNMYDETDLSIGVAEIISDVGKIKYVFEEKERTYYPDIYIKSEHKIIEVKSKWTFNKWKEKNLVKEQACIQQGFKFEFMLF